MSSIIEPMTPPDYGPSGSDSTGQFRFPDEYSHQYDTPHTTNMRTHSDSTPDSFSGGSRISPAPSSSHNNNYISPINTNIGGNKFRSRFKSLSSMDDLDHKFNNIALGPVITNKENQLQPSPIINEHLPGCLNRSVNIVQFAGTTRNPIVAPGSIPSLQQLAPTNPTNASANAANTSVKNVDDLSLVPIESLDILKLSVDQYGCRFLQKRIDGDNQIVSVVFNKIFNNLLDLIIDPFGNYLIQKLVDHILPFQKDLMMEKIHPHLFVIATNQYGTRSLQKIIDTASNSYQMDLIVKGLEMDHTTNSLIDVNNVVRLIKDLNGNHVIQKCIYKFPPEKFQFIIDSICLSNNIVRISTHKHGCCVLQKLLNNADFNQVLKISHVLLVYLDGLINDQFGNYIIQFLFELNFLKTSEKMNFLVDEFFNKIFNNLVKLSCLKFSSNVIEKFIKILKTKKNYVYLTEIIKLTNSNFDILIRDKFGNYVIQTLLDQFYDVNELSAEMANLITSIKKFLPMIRTAPYGKKMHLKVQQLEACHSVNHHHHQLQPSDLNSFPDHRRQGNYHYGNIHYPQPQTTNYFDYNDQQHYINPPPYYNIHMNQYNEANNYGNEYNVAHVVGGFINTSQ